MIKNYIKIAWRNLLKHKGFTSINIFGLAVGIAVTMLVGLWIVDEFGFNNYFSNKNTIAQVYQQSTYEGTTYTGEAMPRPLEFELREKYGENFKHIVMSSWHSPAIINQGEKSVKRKGYFMQSGATEMLDLKIVKGDKNALNTLDAIMLSETLAQVLFEGEDPIGKTLRIDSEYDVQVMAVYEDLPKNTTFYETDYMMSWDKYVSNQSWVKKAVDQWSNNSFQIFAQINDNTTFEAVNEKIKDVKKDAAPDYAEFDPVILLFPMDQWRLYSEFENGKQVGGRIDYIKLFGVIALFVLLLACINFINLSTARSEKRASEVGIRKAIGSKRSQLFVQFLSESVMMVVMAYVVAMGLVVSFLGAFNQLVDQAIRFPWVNPIFWGVSLVFIGLISLLSGSYPALYLSSFKPVKVLKGTFKSGRNSALPRKILVVAQFTVSAVLIVGTLIVIKQINYTKDRSVGYEREGLVEIPVVGAELRNKADVFRNELLAAGAIEDMGTSSGSQTMVYSTRGGYDWEGRPKESTQYFVFHRVSYDYMNAIKAQFVEGRNFSREFASDSLGVIINETAAKVMNLDNPVGQFITQNDTNEKFKIVGVIKDIIVDSPYNAVHEALYFFDDIKHINNLYARIHPNESISASIAAIEKVFRTHFPNLPFEYKFVDKNYESKFRSEQLIAKGSKVLTILAILISCLGLLGLTAFVVERRTKEIGIRKVLGASVKQLWVLVSKDFMLLVGLSFFIAFPLVYYIMNDWLQKYTYRTEITADVFLYAALGALLISLLTVSTQAIKAAVSNPVKAIKTE